MKNVKDSKVVVIGLGFLMEYIHPCFKNALQDKVKDNIIGVTADEKDLQGKMDRLGYKVLLNDNAGALKEMKPDIIFFAPPPTLAKELTETVLVPYFKEIREKGESIPTLFAFPPSPAGKYYMDTLGNDLQVINIIPNMMSKAGEENIANERCNLITYPLEGNWPDEDKQKVNEFFSPFGDCLNCTPNNILHVLSTEIATHPLTELCDVAARKFNEKGIDCDYKDVASVLRSLHQRNTGYKAKNTNNCSLDDLKDNKCVELLNTVLNSWYKGLHDYISENGLTDQQATFFLNPLFDIYFHITQVTSRDDIVAKAKKDATKGGMLELCMQSYYSIIEPLLNRIFSFEDDSEEDIELVGEYFKEIIAAVVERGSGLTKNREIVFSPKQHAIIFGLLAKEYLNEFDNGDALLFDAVARYGRERGSRMAQRCKANGDDLDMVGYFAYSEWKWDGGFSKKTIQTEPYFAHYVFECPWCSAWKESGLEEYGQYYCRNVDLNICKGFNQELDLKMPSYLSGPEFNACEFHWVDACMNEEFSKKQNAIKEKIGESALKSFEYHTAHTYSSMIDELNKVDKNKAKEIAKRVRNDFAKLTSYEELMRVLAETFHNFEIAD